MKKRIALLLCVCMLLCLAACGEKPAPPTQTGPTVPTQTQPTTQTTLPQEPDPVPAVQPLTLVKTLRTDFEWAEDYDRALVRSEHSTVTLAQEDAEAFPEMAQVLNRIAENQTNTMAEEFGILVSAAREELDRDRDGFESYVSTLDVQVRRADQLVISLLTDSYSHYGSIEHYRVFHGSNFDPKTGEALVLSDVIPDVTGALAEAVQAELTSHVLFTEFYDERVVADYFANTPDDSISWTLDYNGVTFYFAPGVLSDGGMMTATVSFAQYPELFAEQYMTVPEAYTVELPRDISFFTELDRDSALEMLSVSGWYDDERNAFLDYGVYTDTDGQYYYEECYANYLHPYYVKAGSGHYVYLFCENFEEGTRLMDLVVLRLNADGSVTKAGAGNFSPAWLSDQSFLVPADPACLLLDDPDSSSRMTAHTVGEDGMPTR